MPEEVQYSILLTGLLCFLLIIIIVIALNSILNIESDEINKNFLIEIIITFNNDHGTLISILFDSWPAVVVRQAERANEEAPSR